MKLLADRGRVDLHLAARDGVVPPCKKRPKTPSREPSCPMLVHTTKLPEGPAAILGRY